MKGFECISTGWSYFWSLLRIGSGFMTDLVLGRLFLGDPTIVENTRTESKNTETTGSDELV